MTCFSQVVILQWLCVCTQQGPRAGLGAASTFKLPFSCPRHWRVKRGKESPQIELCLFVCRQEGLKPIPQLSAMSGLPYSVESSRRKSYLSNAQPKRRKEGFFRLLLFNETGSQHCVASRATPGPRRCPPRGEHTLLGCATGDP